MRHSTLFVFDIETIPDTDVVKKLTKTKSKSVEKLRKELEEYHIENTGNPFPRQPFHKVVAISFLEADIEYNDDGTENYILKTVRSGGFVESSEEEVLKGFFSYLGKKRPRFVSYNGRTFDLPVLKYRAMKYSISAPWLYKSGDKWNNYNQRYSLDWHCDLLEAFSDFGASSRVKMNEVCSIVGVPGKLDTDGSQVTDLFDKGKIKEIRDYCETDALNTYLLYLVYQHHTGTISETSFLDACDQVKSFLEKGDKKEQKHFHEFLDAWKKADEGRVF